MIKFSNRINLEEEVRGINPNLAVLEPMRVISRVRVLKVQDENYVPMILKYSGEDIESARQYLPREINALEELKGADSFVAERTPRLIGSENNGRIWLLKDYIEGSTGIGINFYELGGLINSIHELGVSRLDILTCNVIGGAKVGLFDFDIARTRFHDGESAFRRGKTQDYVDFQDLTGMDLHEVVREYRS